MRVAHATMLSQDGTDVKTIQESLGHEHVSTTQIYLRSLSSGAFRQVVEDTFRFTRAK